MLLPNRLAEFRVAPSKRWWVGSKGKAIAIILVVALVGALAFAFRENLSVILTVVEELVASAGAMGPVVFAVVYGVWQTLLLPGAPLIGLAGTLFAAQPLIGMACISFGSAIAQGVAFFLAQRFARERVREQVGGKAWFMKLEHETENRGARAVLIYRLMMFLPQAPANYAFGLTSVRFVPYLLASVVGTLPSVILYIGGIAGLVQFLKA